MKEGLEKYSWWWSVKERNGRREREGIGVGEDVENACGVTGNEWDKEGKLGEREESRECNLVGRRRTRKQRMVREREKEGKEVGEGREGKKKLEGNLVGRKEGEEGGFFICSKGGSSRE